MVCFMPRANRHHIPNQVWHITHRCHQADFLFKFAKDRKCWLEWLYEARKRYQLCILNYMVTSNHIHLLVMDDKNDTISKSMQLVAGRTAQAFNRRKGRKGAFWEDRYHATAIESGEHLLRCLIYIDMNMVRAGAVTHPSEWQYSGYHEIQSLPQRYRLIDRQKLIDLTGMHDEQQLQHLHKEWIQQACSQNQAKQAMWAESVAVGSESFVLDMKAKKGFSVLGRKASLDDDIYTLREPESAYNVHLHGKKVALSSENTVYFDERL